MNYKVLGTPMSIHAPANYRGLYRAEPFPRANPSERFLSLWRRYVENIEPRTALSQANLLSLDELREFARLATTELRTRFEVVAFADHIVTTEAMRDYGYDVVGSGGYSVIGEGMFPVQNERKENEPNIMERYRTVNAFLCHRINLYGLVSMRTDAWTLADMMNDITRNFPDTEQENWQAVKVVGIG